MKTEFQNSIARLSLCHIMDIKIACDSKTISEEIEKYINSTRHEF